MRSQAPNDADDKAAALVEKAGGKVTRDDKRPGKPIVEVSLIDTQMTDPGLRGLARSRTSLPST